MSAPPKPQYPILTRICRVYIYRLQIKMGFKKMKNPKITVQYNQQLYYIPSNTMVIMAVTCLIMITGKVWIGN
jgi:hypothetical protein